MLLVTTGCGQPDAYPPATGESSSAGAGGAGAACAGNTAYVGTLDGRPANGSLGSLGGYALTPGLVPEVGLMVLDIEPGGVLVFPNLVTDDAPHPLALLRWPDDGSPEAGVWFAFGDGTQAFAGANAHVSFVATSAVRLGACPSATPVAGSFDYCDGGTGSTACSGQATTTTASIDGVPLPWTSKVGAGANEQGLSLDEFWLDDAFVSAQQTPAGPRGILSVPMPGDPTHGTAATDGIFCIGSGTLGFPDSNFGDLSRLPSFAAAPKVSGSIHGCL